MHNEKGIVHLFLIIIILILIVVGYFLINNGTIKNPLPNVIKTSSTEPSIALQTKYENPFDKSAQYVNPFDSYKNPFDSLK